MEPQRSVLEGYACPHCEGKIDYRETVNAGRMWFCMSCTFCTSFKGDLKKKEEEISEEKPRPRMTEEAKTILAKILVV